MVYEKGIEVDKTKEEVSEIMPPSTSLKGVHSFLGHPLTSLNGVHNFLCHKVSEMMPPSISLKGVYSFFGHPLTSLKRVYNFLGHISFYRSFIIDLLKNC